MERRTKIIATIGPASDSETTLRELVNAGMDVARLGLAHGTLDEALERYRRVRKISKDMGKRVGILVDLPGPKIRSAPFPSEGSLLEKGSTIKLIPGVNQSSETIVEVDYENVLEDLVPGDVIPFGDGQVVVRVETIGKDEAEATVTSGGVLHGRPGIRIPSERLSLPTPTDDDLYKLDAFVEEGVDMVAVSYVRSAHDVRRVGTEPHPRGPLVVAKIETRAAVENLTGIIEASAAIMVARGDLGTEFEIADLPHLQKKIIAECIAGGLPVITATQMLDSMINTSSPTRAEASDVANAVFDGTSAVMLSGETAIGSYPVESVETMARIAERADQSFDFGRWAERVAELRQSSDADSGNGGSQGITDAMTLATWRAANELDLAALLCISGSGFTVRSMARFRPNVPILGMTMDERTAQQLTLSWGVTPFCIETAMGYEERIGNAIATAKSEGILQSNDLIGVLAGITGDSPATDVLRIMRVV
ncbi:MAG TPA: pyruvate kinase [Acidimicrobiaceae bacterium]|jgi:pyruvate kinase|nr:pyruvate kinase [Acidimicrobiaceae bacterium]|tara:strand:+ start:1451 stop:2893 length:1443 start_codon:yes stop_codon:yes gene_type:complete